jgi:sulfopyruvate decarboxylase subunit beta
MSIRVSEKIIEALDNSDVEFFATFPCEKVRTLYDLIPKHFRQVSLSREEEGVGICAGASLAGVKAAMLTQSSGIGNMINALLSLTKTYEMPLFLMISWRGVYNEKIPAQVLMGEKLPQILKSIGVDYSIIKAEEDIPEISDFARRTYDKNGVSAVLLNPVLWSHEEREANEQEEAIGERRIVPWREKRPWQLEGVLTRLEVLRALTPYLNGKIVVCNLGVPCKELYYLSPQRSNFYMLGSMGLASSVGLGISLFTSKEVVVIDGDGSLLMNLGALSTIAVAKPKNLTILAIDNGVHGSTGNQPTATSSIVDLEMVARALGFEKTSKVAERREIQSVVEAMRVGPNFVHVLAIPGNADVPNVPLTPVEIKRNVMECLRASDIQRESDQSRKRRRR